MNRQRGRKRTNGGPVLADVEDRRPTPAQQLADSEQRQQLWEAAAAMLTEPQMTATWLFYVEEMPIKEIARVLERSQVATKTMLFRARKRLLPIFRQWESDDPTGRATG
jgi:RNA polymerase sigma factor (sigma-70 family)